jgi:hypothetical protein
MPQTKTELWYLSARLTGATPEETAANLARAEELEAELSARWATEHPEREVWAPWIHMARAGVEERRVWRALTVMIGVGHGFVMMLDGKEPSLGMRRERMLAYGLQIEEMP